MTQTLRIDQHPNGAASPTQGASSAADNTAPSPFPPGAAAVTAEQIAHALQLSLKTVRRLDAERRIPGRIQLGRRVRFRRVEVEEWIAAGCPAPGARRRPR